MGTVLDKIDARARAAAETLYSKADQVLVLVLGEYLFNGCKSMFTFS